MFIAASLVKSACTNPETLFNKLSSAADAFTAVPPNVKEFPINVPLELILPDAVISDWNVIESWTVIGLLPFI